MDENNPGDVNSNNKGIGPAKLGDNSYKGQNQKGPRKKFKQKLAKGIESFLIKANAQAHTSKAILSRVSSNTNKSDFDRSLNADNLFKESKNEIKIINLGDSDAEDFDIPSRREVEHDARQDYVTRAAEDLESIFKTYSRLQTNAVSFSPPPKFCEGKFKSFFLRPSTSFNVKGKRAVIDDSFSKFFKECSLSNLLKREHSPRSLTTNLPEFDDNWKNTSDVIDCIDLKSLEDNIGNIRKRSSPICNDLAEKKWTPKDLGITKSITELSREKTVLPDEEGPVRLSFSPPAVEEQAPFHESSVLLTPPATTKRSPPKENECSSPHFMTRRPIWIKDSPMIVSSTPVTNKAKRLFGNSSINITPISLIEKDKFINEQEIRESGMIKTNPSGISEDKIPVKKEVKKEDTISQVNFDLTLDDDDIFRDIDLEAIYEEHNAKKYSQKDKSTKENSHGKDNSKIKDNEAALGNQRPKLMTVTQIIDFVDDQNGFSTKSSALKPVEGKQNESALSNSKIFTKGTSLLRSFFSLKEDQKKGNIEKNKNFNETHSSSFLDAHEERKEEREVLNHAPHSGVYSVPKRNIEVEFDFGLDVFEDDLGHSSTHNAQSENKNLWGNESEDMFKDLDSICDETFKPTKPVLAWNKQSIESTNHVLGGSLSVPDKSLRKEDANDNGRRSIVRSLFQKPESVAKNPNQVDSYRVSTSPQTIIGNNRLSSRKKTCHSNMCSSSDSSKISPKESWNQKTREDLTQSHLKESPIIKRRKTCVNILDSQFDETLDVSRTLKDSTSGSSFQDEGGASTSTHHSDDDFQVPPPNARQRDQKVPTKKRKRVSTLCLYCSSLKGCAVLVLKKEAVS